MAKKPLRSVAPKDSKQDLEGVKKSEVVDGSTGVDPGVDYMPKKEIGQKFVAAHKTEKWASRAGNKGDVFSGDKVKYALDTPQNKLMGRDQKESEKVYEASKMKCESCGNMYEGESCDCGKMKKGGKKNLILSGGKGLQEVITKNTPTGEVIHDIVHSKNKMFKDDSKEQRIKRALGAKYAMMRKEEKDNDDTDEEISMVGTELRAICADAEDLLAKMPKDMHIEPWVQSKVAVAKSMISGVRDYMLNKKPVKEDLAMPMLEDGKKKKKKEKMEKESAPADTTMNLNTYGTIDQGRV